MANTVVKVTDADSRVHFAARSSAIATAAGSTIEEVADDDATQDAPDSDSAQPRATRRASRHR